MTVRTDPLRGHRLRGSIANEYWACECGLRVDNRPTPWPLEQARAWHEQHKNEVRNA